MSNFSESVLRVLDATAAYDRSVLRGKSVIITGGGSGLGEAFAHEFANAGAYVTIGDINEVNGQRVARKLGQNAQYVKCDITNWHEQLDMFKKAISSSPNRSCDIVIANAGIARADDVYRKEETEEPKEPELSTFKVLTIGTIYTIKLAMHYFSRQPDLPERDRCLLLTSSLAGYIGQAENPQYCAGKWAVRALMRSFSETCEEDGIRINLIAPTFIATPLLSSAIVNHLQDRGINLASAVEAAQAMLHLACDKRLNGRAIAIVTRDVDPQGYFDLMDEPHTDFLKRVQQGTRRARANASPK